MTLIQHQTQPCPISCVSTCIAMLANIPAQEVIDKHHTDYRENGLTLRGFLDAMGIPFQSFDTCDDAPLENVGAYLVVVPSLNIVGGTHQIIIEVTEDDYFVVDPCQGRPVRYYVKRGADTTDPKAVELNGFGVDAFIDAHWLRYRT